MIQKIEQFHFYKILTNLCNHQNIILCMVFLICEFKYQKNETKNVFQFEKLFIDIFKGY